MSDRAEKRYAGQAKIRGTQYGDAVDLMLFPDDLKAIGDRVRELAAAGKPGEPVKLSFMQKKQPKNAWTHYGVIDTWEPAPRNEAPAVPADPPAETRAQIGLDDQPSDLPF